MNKQDFDLLKKINELFKKIPTIIPGGGGATITADVFIASATDLRIGRDLYLVAIESHMHAQIWKNILRTRDDIDVDDAKEQIDSYIVSRNKAMTSLSKFVASREEEKWCKPSLSKVYIDYT
ncbi:MAG: hypothetical protein N4A40_12505 [Tissierellales bacterium]|jgi:hypothetical protein|nr:hypothetical protein [Tissierellales bacterium]